MTRYIETYTSKVKRSYTMDIVKYGGKTYVNSIDCPKKRASDTITTVIVRCFAG